MLYTRDPLTGEHLVVDGDEVLRLNSRAEALEIANRRYLESRKLAGRSRRRG